jgi:hypothetical protein
MIKYQVTAFDTTGKYRPVASIVTVAAPYQTKEEKMKIVQKGVEKICVKRYWGKADLKKYGYSKVKIRVVEE